MATWIDFKVIREHLRIADILDEHNVQLTKRGDTATGLCPLPTHPVRTDGTSRSPSFSVHLGKGIWHCFGCGAKGNVLDLATRLQGLNPDDPLQLRQAALQLAATYGIACERPNGRQRGDAATTTPRTCTSQPTPLAPHAPSLPGMHTLINEPIDFELKHLDAQHPYLTKRNLTPQTIAHFGLGFCARGMMKDRLAIPIHDALERLVGYAGRLVDDARIDAEHPKYLFPGRRTHDGVIHEFRKSALVYNLHRVARHVNDLIVVEGFASVWWLHQHGYPNVVALMGNSCSSEQASVIAGYVNHDTRLWLLPDNDGAGAQMAAQSLPLLAIHRFTTLVKLNEHEQPTECGGDDLDRLLGSIRRD